MAVGYLVNALAQPLQRIGETTYGLLLHDEETFNELQDYVADGKGGYTNGQGSYFDDRVMALGIALATHYIDPPVLPYQADTSMRERVAEIKQEIKHEITDVTVHDEAPEAPWEQWSEESGENV
jgi:hypothetical protein